MRRYRDVAPKLLTLGWSDWIALGKAQVALLRARRELRRRPIGELVRQAAADRTSYSTEDRFDEVHRLATALRRAASFGLFRPLCLVRSLGLKLLLEDAGITDGVVRVGVQVEGGKFVAHAWVEYRGMVAGDDAELIARYRPLSGIQLAEFQ